MKNPRMQSKRSAFTLIELLVVISIIAVLASLSFPAITGVMVNARKVQAKNDMSQIASAIKMYYTEYGRYPIDSTTATTDQSAVYGAGDTGNEQIINVLRYVAADANAQKLNTRQIKFIEPKVTTASKACVNNANGRWFDPWGMQYVIFIDADYANDIDASAAFGDIDPAKPEVSVGVASGGYHYVKNKLRVPTILTKRAFDKSNDLLSWQ